MTALAAVIALSTTPAFAQAIAPDAAQPPAAIAPASTSQAAPVEAAAPPSEAAPIVSQAEAAPIAQEAPIPAPIPTMQPIVHQATAADLPATQAAERPAVTRTATPVAKRVRAEPARPAAAASATTVAPAARTAPPVATAEPAAAPTPIRRPATATTVTNGIDENALPYVGAGLAALLLLGGVAAVSRRRRRDELTPADRYEQEPTLELGTPERVADRSLGAPILARAIPAQAAAATLPNGFDLSRYGRHTQAAYRGPSAENPSLSLRKRLKRASFFDGRERIAAEAGTAPIAATPAMAARTATPQAATNGQIVIRPRPAKTGNFFRPSYAR